MSSNASQVEQTPVIPDRSPKKTSGKKKPYVSRKVYLPSRKCDGPGCDNMAPGGMYLKKRKYLFCSPLCQHRFTHLKYVIGTCLECGGPVLGGKSYRGKGRFCSWEHRRKYYRGQMEELTGPFVSLIDEYLKLTNRYRKRTIPIVKSTLIQFFGFVRTEGIDRLEDITPAVVTRFMAWQRERGLTRANYITRVKALFDWLYFEGRATMRNPVIPRYHYEKKAPDQPRPFSDQDLVFIQDLVEKGESPMLKLAFAIGKECGLRIGEVCNIRVSDVDRDKQKIHVRLPTKNMQTRDVPYHDEVTKYLGLWLNIAGARSGDDHLLCGAFGAALNTNTLIARFKSLLGDQAPPADSFKFHRLRHTWATRLMNNGMELAVLKELGGWVNWNSMQRYIRVLPNTIRRQYEETYARIQQSQIETPEDTISLLDFAQMSD